MGVCICVNMCVGTRGTFGKSYKIYQYFSSSDDPHPNAKCNRYHVSGTIRNVSHNPRLFSSCKAKQWVNYYSDSHQTKCSRLRKCLNGVGRVSTHFYDIFSVPWRNFSYPKKQYMVWRMRALDDRILLQMRSFCTYVIFLAAQVHSTRFSTSCQISIIM